LVKVEAGSLLLVEGEDLVFKVAIGDAGNRLKGQRIKMGQGVAGWVAATGEPMVVRDVKNDPHFFAGLDNLTGFETRNLICIPMIFGGKTIGVIELLNKDQGTFTNEDLKMLKPVASSAAIALENSRLYSASIDMARKERIIRNIFQKYVPKEVADEILDLGERDLISLGEKKMVTLLNVDLRGYSSLAKKVSAEDTVEVLNYFFMVMGTIILKHNGILDKYLGDGLLAIFGAPVASSNPTLDTTLAAIEMVEGMKTVNKFAKNLCGAPLKIGISINTGEAIVGNIGFDKKMDYTVIGDVVNDLFLLQDLTREKPDSILISSSTLEQIEPFVNVKSLGKKTIGTKESTMEVYEVTGRKEMSDLEFRIEQARVNGLDKRPPATPPPA
ncbi:MAG: adenylate/guanylate cyclase domain-containing protein, partial [Gemmatimonadota bacterium]|nr:adenylate/guanylate cyclase domain-containing protein [Gemmatimonadota bacterium]